MEKEIKLELKHILPYFGHGIKAKTKGGDLIEINRIDLEDKKYPVWAMSHGDCENQDFNYQFLAKQGLKGRGFSFEKLSLILRPLSDLAKEIDGEIPAAKLAKVVGGSYECTIVESNKKTGTILVRDKFGFCKVEIIPEAMQIRLNGYYASGKMVIDAYNFLLENHYDVFRLIEQGLAIDINTIEK